MNIRRLLGRLTGLIKAERKEPTAEELEAVTQTTADVLWIQRVAGRPAETVARLLYTTNPRYAEDLIFLSRLSHRLVEVLTDETTKRRYHKVLEQLSTPIRKGQRLLLPASFCCCSPTYLHDVAWDETAAGPDIDLSDSNSLRRLRLTPDSRRPILDPVLPGDA